MKKKILVVVLCIVMFCAGCAVTGALWGKDTAEYAARIAELEQTLTSANERILELTTEVTMYELDMKKLELFYGIDVEELLN